MTENLKTTPTAALSRLVDDTETTLVQLKAELKRREEAAQHREIDRLDEHLADAHVSLSKIKEFFDYVLKELKS